LRAGKQGPLGYIPVFIANALYPLKYVLCAAIAAVHVPAHGMVMNNGPVITPEAVNLFMNGLLSA
jgi:hypothetical protein